MKVKEAFCCVGDSHDDLPSRSRWRGRCGECTLLIGLVSRRYRVALEVLRSGSKAFEVSSILGPSRVSVLRRFRSLFAGLEHQSGSVWFARLALRRALFGGGDSFVAGLTLACFAHPRRMRSG